jgi:hypothetical protein
MGEEAIDNFSCFFFVILFGFNDSPKTENMPFCHRFHQFACRIADIILKKSTKDINYTELFIIQTLVILMQLFALIMAGKQ